MALFQILRGKAANLASKAFHDGYAYLTPDDGAFYIDAETDGEQKRIHINPKPDLQEITADEVQSTWDSYPPSYLTFSSPNSFTMNVATPGWDGTMEYSTDKSTWTTWGGSQISAVDNGGTYELHIRGTGNTKVTGGSSNKWALNGNNIACNGNIESLLDYTTVAAGNHPTMVSSCYRSMFDGCTSLTTAPALPATTLAGYCYSSMFDGCTSLTTAPALPATTLASDCYNYMFSNCTSLTTAPALPATKLASYCYRFMFRGCTGLTTAPALPATTLASDCYSYMFNNCTSLTTAPALPATKLAGGCYDSMFSGCTGLTTAPALPATTLAYSCYFAMFDGCTRLTTAPALPATTLVTSCYNHMFGDCTSLKLSATQTGNYTRAYRIPTSGTGTIATNALSSMFSNTGGTFTGDPEINTTYYLDASNTIV